MKCLVISENDTVVSGFRTMGLEAVFAPTDEAAVSEVEKAISSRKVGTLILSRHVESVSRETLDSHRESGRLPFVILLKD